MFLRGDMVYSVLKKRSLEIACLTVNLRNKYIHLHLFHGDEMNGVCAVKSFLHFGLSILS